MSPRKTRRLYQAGAVLLDVRSQREWDAGHAKGALFIPWLSVNELSSQLLPDKRQTYVTYCAVGVRAWLAARQLRKLGYKQVVAMSGGYKDLAKVGYAIETVTTHR